MNWRPPKRIWVLFIDGSMMLFRAKRDALAHCKTFLGSQVRHRIESYVLKEKKR